MAEPAKKIPKPQSLKTMDKLNRLQMASLYGVTPQFMNSNTKLINSLLSTVQGVVSNNNKSIGASTPQFIANAARTNKDINTKQSVKNSEAPITGLKWLTDTDQDMDVFRELQPYAAPTFELFYEYQMVKSMIPEVSKCLRVLKTSILSADSFSKEYLIPKYDDMKSASSNDVIDNVAEKNISMIKDIIEEYDLNKFCDKQIDDAMYLGAKPVLVVPIDKNFRESAKRVLYKTESANGMLDVMKEAYSDGIECNFESAIDDLPEIKGVAMENGEHEQVLDYTKLGAFEGFNNDIDELLAMYENAFEIEVDITDTSEMSFEEARNFDNKVKNHKNAIKNAKKKVNRKKLMKQLAMEVSKWVNERVHYSLLSESMAIPLINKVANRNKTNRKVKKMRSEMASGRPKSSLAISFEDYYEKNPEFLEEDVEDICDTLNSQVNVKVCKMESKIQAFFDKKTGEKTWKKVNYESYSYVPRSYRIDGAVGLNSVTPVTFEVDYGMQPGGGNIGDADPSPYYAPVNGKPLNINDFEKSTLEAVPTGSVLIPLSPDTVVPISAQGKHIGYYIIERLGGGDDLGIGMGTLLGYRNPGSNYNMGLGSRMATGMGAMGNDGAGIILRDMTDIPMNSRDDGRRAILLKNMIIRAISERVGNPDIVDDGPFNSIVYSLIKDNYISHKDIKITYVPADMLVYFAHEIKSENGVGKSLLEDGLFFAHVYISSLVTNLMIAIAKSADREQVNVEVGYNKQYEATVQKVMRTLQTKRASIDSIGSVDTIMKTLGTFQRYISVRHNGQAMVEIETIPGQQVDLDNSLQEKALKSVINTFDVPASALNFLDDTEYARSISLSNGLFLDRVVNMQEPYMSCISKLGRILIRNKHPEKILTRENIKRIQSSPIEKSSGKKLSADDLIDITKVYIDLPAPQGLNISAMSEQMSTIGSYANDIIDIVKPLDLDSEYDEQFTRAMKYLIYKDKMPTLDYDNLEDMVHTARAQVEQLKLKVPNSDDLAGGGFGGDSGGGDSGGFGFGDDSGGGDMGFGDLGGGDSGGGDSGGDSGGDGMDFNFGG